MNILALLGMCAAATFRNSSRNPTVYPTRVHRERWEESIDHYPGYASGNSADSEPSFNYSERLQCSDSETDSSEDYF